MLDATALEKLGKPTVVVAHDTFALAARAQAGIFGVPDLPVAVMPRPRPDWDAARQQAELRAVFERAMRSVGGYDGNSEVPPGR